MSESNAPDKPDLARGIAVAELPEGHMIAGTFEGRDVLLALSAGRYFALEATCTHLGAPLAEGIVVDGCVHCPWHHARFSLASGEAVGAPALQPVACYRTSVRGDRVVVTEALSRPSRTRAGDHERDVVIVGAGAAGYACAELLARHGFNGRITLLSDDPDTPYERTLCSKQYLIGQSSRDETRFRNVPPAIRRISGRVASIDVERRRVTVGEESLAFDVLVLATGARPVRPEMPGFDHANVHVLRTMRDAEGIIAASRAAQRVAIVGASFIGLEAAASLRQRGLEVDVIAPGAVPLARVMGDDIGRMIQQVHAEQGVRFHLGRRALRYDGALLHLDHGGSLAADFVVAGTGVTPNTELASAAGLRCAPPPLGGVLVDERLETSVAGIYAVGDIAAYPDVHSAKRQRIEHWVHAQRQGQFVARALLGEADRFTDVPFFWSAHFDTGLTYIGHVTDTRSAALEGSIDGRDFLLRLTGAGEEKALIACSRDASSLLVEAHWDHARVSAGAPVR